MHIAIIGSGNVGKALATRWLTAGHTIIFGSRSAHGERMQEILTQMGAHATATTQAEAAAQAAVVVLAIPSHGFQEIVAGLGNLDGKVVIDCINPLTATFDGVTLGTTTSVAEQVAALLPGASVVKAFNHIGAGVMLDPQVGERAATLFICGDDAAAKQTVNSLATEIGFAVEDAGALTAARLLEPLAALWVSLAYTRGLGPNIAFALLRR